jgi:diguanylate cyclase (GGDEF)-like protein
MSPAAVTYLTMLFLSLIMAGAMALGWASFGRPRHALTWSLAYALYALELASSGLASLLVPVQPVLGALARLSILGSAALLVVGARQRVGLPDWTKRLAIVAGLTFVASEMLDLIPALGSLAALIGSMFTLAMLPFVIAAIQPRGRRPDAAEWALTVTLSAFCLFEILFIGSGLASYPDPGDAQLHAFHRNVYLIGLMPVFVANGIAAVLLLAFDLAAKLRALASHDPLTGVLNRRGFHDAAVRAIANGRRQRQSLAVAIADIDHFKSINDRFGHTAGDNTLRYICTSLASGLRTEDLVGRVGGEEFALLLVNSTAEQAAQAMERIRIEVAEGFSDDGAPVPVTISFGVAPVVVSAGSAETALAEALDEADRALYRSKLEGRNRTTLADAA